MLSRSELKNRAKQDIKGNVFICFIAAIIPVLIAGLPSALFSRGGEPIIYFIGIINLIVTIFIFPMQTGVKLVFLQLSESRKSELNNLVVPYKNGAMWEIIKAKLLSALYIILGFICFVIPGIYLALKYAMVDYVFADNPDLKYDEAMKMSGEIMKGQKMRLFVLGLSFILWFFAIIFTIGIALIYVIPYIEATIANFYMDIRIEKAKEPEFVENNDYLRQYISEE